MVSEYGKDAVEFEDCEVVAEKFWNNRNDRSAILVQIPGFEEPVWIPYSQIHDDSEIYAKGDTGSLIISRWIAEEKGLV